MLDIKCNRKMDDNTVTLDCMITDGNEDVASISQTKMSETNERRTDQGYDHSFRSQSSMTKRITSSKYRISEIERAYNTFVKDNYPKEDWMLKLDRTSSTMERLENQFDRFEQLFDRLADDWN